MATTFEAGPNEANTLSCACRPRKGAVRLAAHHPPFRGWLGAVFQGGTAIDAVILWRQELLLWRSLLCENTR